MISLYPLKFHPILKDRIWGGTKLAGLYGKNLPPEVKMCGESWELSAVEGNVSVVSNGYLAGNDLQELIEVYMDELVGDRVFKRFGDEFPLLIKLIDASDVLSIQVHPKDELAMQRHNAFGKSEMWYILEAEEPSDIITGFNRTLSPEEYKELLRNGAIREVLKHERAKPNDFFFIPAGKVHAIGKGIVLAEIQQTSDITYRIYDWDRLDPSGMGRELHTELALEAIDFKKAADTRQSLEPLLNTQQELVSCPYFKTNRLTLDKPLSVDLYDRDSFTVYMCTQGGGLVHCQGSEGIPLAQGELLLVPAGIHAISLVPNREATLLEVFVP